MSNHPQKSGSLCSGMSGSLCSGMSGSLCSGIGGSLYPGIGGSLYPGILTMLLFYEQNNISAFKNIFIGQFEFAVNTYF